MKDYFNCFFKLNRDYYGKSLFFVPLLVLLLFSCLFAYVPSTNAQSTVYVGTQTELRTAVTSAVGHTVIVLTADIQLTSTPLNIASGKDIVLTSNSSSVFFRLIGASGQDTITVAAGGRLELAGVTVTHPSGVNGRGVYVNSGGVLTLSGGAISGNRFPNVSGNTSSGSAVYNSGIFTMSGGTITNNIGVYGGGIFNYNGNFTMSAGTIAGNTAYAYGGGISSYNGNFAMSGGTVTNNTAQAGGGIHSTGTSIFTLSGGTITNNTAISGGGIHNSGTFTMSNGTIANNTATKPLVEGLYNRGGGINNNGTLTLLGGTIANNTAYQGGGIDNSAGGTFAMSGGTITSNTAILGGGIGNDWGGTFAMSGGTVTNNTATNGGGIYTDDPRSSITMSGGTIANNTAFRGGGIHIRNGNYTLSGGEISNNTASNVGGGIDNYNGTFVMSAGTIAGNTAYAYGGGIFTDTGGISRMSAGTIAGNTAYAYGGGIAVDGVFVMSGGAIANNTAELGGGMFSYEGVFTMSGGAIANNTATYDGGGIFNYNGNVTLSWGIISNNTAESGGGIYNGGTFTMLNGTIANNIATNGGGIYLETGFVRLFGGIVTNNTAAVDGGGVWVAHQNLNRLFVYDGVVFSNNRASAAYNRNPADDATYYAQIGSNVTWTTPFTQGYNNYDISYTNGTPAILYSVTVNDSYASITGAGNYQAGDVVTVNAGTRSGYTFVGWTINQGNITLPNTPTATFTMPPTNVVVTANWQKVTLDGSFSVTKLTVPSGVSTVFNFITSALPGTFSLTDGTTWNSGSLSPGNYTLTEIDQAGWDLANIIINDPTNNSRVDLASRTVFIALDPGETITILYQNTQQSPQTGSISVTKTACPVGYSGVFNFVTSAPAGTFSLTDGATWQSGPIAPGNYTLTEIAQAGWDLTNIIVNDPTNNSRVDLATRTVFIALEPGENISILYQNSQQTPDLGSFSVTKVTCPVGSSEPFRFVTSAPGGSFSLTDGTIWNSGNLPPGTYTVTELVPSGWEITNILLNDPSGTSTVDLTTGTAIINLQAGTHVSIVYQDAQAPPLGGLISVVKAVCPTDTSAQFRFVSSASEGAFSLGNGDVWSSGELSPGRYIITEVMQAGWAISDIVVVDPSNAYTVDLSTGTVAINLQAGSHVTVIYQNTQPQQPYPDCCNNTPCQCQPCNDCSQRPCKCKPTCPPA